MKELTKKNIKPGDTFKVIQDCWNNGKIVIVKNVCDDGIYDFEDKQGHYWKLNTQVIPYVEIDKDTLYKLDQGKSASFDYALISKTTYKPTKQSEGKLFYEVNWEVIEGLAKRMALNKKNGKYDVFGWRDKGVNVDELNQALIRHLVAILKGEYTEDEQQFSHYYAIIANAMLCITELNKQLNK